MANTILHKKSSTPSAVPTTGDLTLGELALNTADGLVYMKKSDNSVIAIGVAPTGAEIKVLYEAEADTNAFDDAAVSKLTGIEPLATADQTGAEIKALYEAELDTNAFDDAALAKLGGIEPLATADQTKVDIDALGIDAATLDGIDSTSFLRSDAADSTTAALTIGAATAISWATAPTNDSHLTNKGYVDALVASGASWKNPVVDSDLVDVISTNPATPEATYSVTTGADIAFIVTGTFTASYGTGTTVAAVPGNIINLTITSSGNGDYSLIETPLTAGDRFILGAEHGLPGTGLTSLVVDGFALARHDLIEATLAGTGDGSSAGDWSVPDGRSGLAGGGTEIAQGVTVLVSDLQSVHHGHTYLYDAPTNAWIEISGPGSIGAGTGLSYTGTTLNVDDIYMLNTGDTHSGSILPSTNNTLNLGSGALKYANVYATTFVGNASTASALETSRTITLAGDLSGSAAFNGSANITITAAVANDSHTHATQYLGLTATAANSQLLDSLDSTAFLRSNAADTHSGTITPSTNNTINLGSGALKYANVYATTFQGISTQAKYADMAEIYSADAAIAPGTVVCFGGTAEVTVCDHDHDQRVAGVVSTNPAYLMNSDADGVAVALQGRVPCKVSGSIKKGDMMVSDGMGGARAEANPKMGSVIGKALEDSEGDAVIEVVVGRM